MSASLKKYIRGNGLLWGLYIGFIIISILLLMSAISQLAFKGSSYTGPIVSHMKMLGMGFVVIVLMVYTKFFHPTSKLFLRLVYLALMAACLMLFYLTFVGDKAGANAARAINVLGLSIQPLEVARFCLLVVVADLTDIKNSQLTRLLLNITGREVVISKRVHFIIILAVVAFTCMPIAFENLSSAVLIAVVVLFMLFSSAEIDSKWLWKTILVGGVAVAALVAILLSLPKETVDGSVFHRFSTWTGRVERAFDSSDDEAEFVITDENYQEMLAKCAVARGGVARFAPGKSVQRDYLPNAYNDYIYSILVEEYGMFGGIFLIFMYVVFLICIPLVVAKQQSGYARAVVFGVAFMIVLQAFVNMVVSVGLFVTGQPLPLISKGGSSILIISAYFGVLLSLSADREIVDNEIKVVEDEEIQILD